MTTPDLSVVMVTHGAWASTERALSALHAHTPPGFELIVVDNASQDETSERLSATEADFVQLDRNVGFASASNLGARRARGRHLCFLNSDAFVTAGWSEPLQAAIDDGAGAAGPRLLYPDGTLQEAGSLVGRDGWTTAYGDGGDPAAEAYRFPRDVDYVSGACMVVSRRDFWEAGGFDSGYRVAYYEDADLCFSLIDRGKPVRYVPGSVVVHAKYGSGSAAAANELSRVNRRRFMSRWGDRLAARPLLGPPPRERAQVAARDAMARERVLIVADVLPRPSEALTSLVSGQPDCRLTIVGREGDAEPLLDAGIEATADSPVGERWVQERFLHYDVVLGSRRALDRLRAPLAVGQPGVPQIVDPPSDPSQLARRLAQAGLLFEQELLVT